MACCSNKGLTDWYLQRGTTAFMSVYFLPILGFWLLNPLANHAQWFEFMTRVPWLVLGVLAWLALGVHAYIGMWVVISDYLSDHLAAQSNCKHLPLFRRLVTSLMGVWVFGSVAVGLLLIIGWGVL